MVLLYHTKHGIKFKQIEFSSSMLFYQKKTCTCDSSAGKKTKLFYNHQIEDLTLVIILYEIY